MEGLSRTEASKDGYLADESAVGTGAVRDKEENMERQEQSEPGVLRERPMPCLVLGCSKTALRDKYACGSHDVSDRVELFRAQKLDDFVVRFIRGYRLQFSEPGRIVTRKEVGDYIEDVFGIGFGGGSTCSDVILAADRPKLGIDNGMCSWQWLDGEIDIRLWRKEGRWRPERYRFREVE